MRPHGTKKIFRHPDRSAADVRVDVNDEVGFHIDMRTEDLMKDGTSEEDARRQALAEFGRLEAGAAAIARFDDRVERRRRLGQFAAELKQDARLGVRLLARSPGFTTVAALMLALGIGANTAIYSVLDAALLRPLPYPDADRVVMVSETLENGNQNSVSGGAFLDWRTHQTQFDALVLTGRVSYNLRGAGTPERLTGMEVSHEFLDVLRVPPLLGRGFLPEEDRPGGPTNVVMLTEELWRSRFGADRSIVGSTIILDEVPRTVVGVLPRGAWLIKEDSFFVPAVLQPNTERTARGGHWAGVFGRVKATSSVSQADAELKAIKLQLNPQYPAFKQRWGVQVETVTDILGGLTRTPMMILLGAVSLVLLIASANVANLLLARGCQREHELSVRAAIGASGGRLIRQILTENLILAALGGGIGIIVASFGVDVLRRVRGLRNANGLRAAPRSARADVLACDNGRYGSRGGNLAGAACPAARSQRRHEYRQQRRLVGRTAALAVPAHRCRSRAHGAVAGVGRPAAAQPRAHGGSRSRLRPGAGAGVRCIASRRVVSIARQAPGVRAGARDPAARPARCRGRWDGHGDPVRRRRLR